MGINWHRQAIYTRLLCILLLFICVLHILYITKIYHTHTHVFALLEGWFSNIYHYTYYQSKHCLSIAED